MKRSCYKAANVSFETPKQHIIKRMEHTNEANPSINLVAFGRLMGFVPVNVQLLKGGRCLLAEYSRRLSLVSRNALV
jgi:hypothetical protein